MHNRLIIFDCFGVIFNEVAPVFLRKYLPEEEAAAVKDKIFVPSDLGQITYDELLDTLIKKLRGTADIALLSNAPLGLVERIFDEYGLTCLFDKMVVSSAIKLAKPDPEIYRYCVAQFDREYDEIYMIDDNSANLEPLEAMGITPILFTSAESVTQVLKV